MVPARKQYPAAVVARPGHLSAAQAVPNNASEWYM